MAKAKEVHFEDEVVEALTEPGGSGWTLGAADGIDFHTGIATDELMTFIGATQIDEWNKLLVAMGNDADRAQLEFRKRLASELDARGTVDVLRNGIKGWGCSFRLCYFRPSSKKNLGLWERYEANRLTVTRQQRYSSKHNNTLDVVLWVNGLAVATVELKNPLSGQHSTEAIKQYMRDRDPKDPFLAKRAVVHFAVDPYVVDMTSELAGARTRFLPFNQGNDHRKGNPPAPSGKHRTAYLWEQVWEREAFLDLIGRFIHTVTEDGKTKTIFPRYHQWDAVRQAEAHAREHGAGQKYLFQHSAGSGKSNSIAWLSHRLSVLHDEFDKPVFDKVIVITDRRVLDDQLSKTVAQFEQTAGVVRRIEDKDASKSKNLAEALDTETARIVICTLQTFSYVDKALAVGQRNYAVVIDEAHSSQTGAAASDLKGVLGAKSEEERLKQAEKAEAGERDHRRGQDRRGPRRQRRRRPTCRSSPSRPPRRPRPSPCSARQDPTADRGRSTCTRCARPSRRASSSTCSPSTRPSTCTGGSARPAAATPRWPRRRRRARSARPSRSTRTTSPSEPRSSSTTIGSTSGPRSADEPRR